MSCKLWIERALPLLEGLLPAPEARAYRAHLEGCPACRAEVESGRSLIRKLGRLPDLEMASTAVAAFDVQVLARVLPAAPAVAAARAVALAPIALAAESAATSSRAAAARSVAARSRQAGRPLFPQLSPLPSLTLASLALSAASITGALFFGEWILRAMSGSFALAFGALSGGGGWLAERVGMKVVEVVTLARVIGRLVSDLGPWGEALQQLVAVRGNELLIAMALVVALFGLAGLLLRREQRKLRQGSRS